MRNILGKEILFNQIDEKIPNKLFFLFLIDALCFTFFMGSDVQPVSAILAFILLFWAALERNFRLTTLTMTFLALAIFSLFYAGFDTNNLFELRAQVSFGFCFYNFHCSHLLFNGLKKILIFGHCRQFFWRYLAFFLPIHLL